MAKPKNNKPAAKPAAGFNAEEFKKLSPAEQAAYVEKLVADKASLENTNKQLATENSKLSITKGKDELPSFEVDEDEDNDIEGGTYQFTSPTFTWDDGIVINVRTLAEETQSNDKKVAEKALAILAKLVAIKSGIVTRKED
jgi:hypothetical protein